MIKDKGYTEHGGDIYTEGKFKGIKLIDFSSNINFLGTPESFKDNVYKALENIECYPDLKYRESKLHIKEYLNTDIDEENIILGNGAAEIINLAVRTLKKPCIVVPSFSEYETTSKSYSENIVFSYLNEEFSYSYDDILEKLKNCDGLVIANPNNPNGGLINRKLFKKIIEYCEEYKKRIIIDEAFIEFADEDKSLIDMCMRYKCLFIIRAFTKFFAMPGIRFGYGVSRDIEFIEELSKLQIPWNVNTFAEIAVKTVLKDEEYIKNSRIKLKSERSYFYGELQKIDFVEKVYESQANFLLLKLKRVSGEEVYSYCISQGILIRRCGNFKGLDDNFIRLAVKKREYNNKLLETFKDFEKIIYGGK